MTAEELLIQNYDSADFYSSGDEKCIIDPDTRTISIPTGYQIFGVESDEKTERIEFQCPKIVGDNIDLSQLQIRINFENANQEKDQYIVADVSEDGDNITFSWVLSRKVTAYRGTVNFIMCAVKVDGDSITNEWNTTLATSQVLEGLEVDTPEPTEEQSDVITQLLNIVKQTSESSVQAVKQAEQEAMERLSTLPHVVDHVILFNQ